MSGNDTPQSVIKKFEKRQKIMPYFLGGLAGMLALLGIFIIIAVASGSKNPFSMLFATKTPTPTATFTPTATIPTSTATLTPTVTETPTPSATATASGPQQYTVKEGDDCWTIAYNFKVELEVLLSINNFNDPKNTCPIVAGKTIWIPMVGQELPTPTPIPEDFPHGTIITYMIRSGDTLATIADRFYTTVKDIMTRNSIKDQNAIEAGTYIQIKYYIATRVPTIQATSTLSITSTPAAPTPTPSATITP
jgi:LysM repeat protein